MFLTAHPEYGFYWCARVASGLGFQVQVVAVGWEIYDITHSTFQLGMVGLVQFIPIVLFTLVAGYVADRYSRRIVYGATIAVQSVGSAVLALGAWRHSLGAGDIFAVVAVIGAARAFQAPSGQALMPTLVPPGLIPTAIAWSAGAFQAATIVGPAIGGLLYAFGPQVPYTLAAVLSLAGALLTLFIGHEGPARPREPATAKSMLSGVHFIRQNPVILGSISLDLFAVLLGGATALLPAYARDILKVGPWGLGALRAAPAVGSLCMSALLVKWPAKAGVGRKMFAAVFAFGLSTVVFGLSRSVALSLASLVVLGAVDTVSVIIRTSLVQLETPDAMRGRVGAVNMLFVGTSNLLGEFESGVTAAIMGTVAATVAGGVATLVVAGLWMRFFPSLVSFDRFNQPSGPAPQGSSADPAP